MQPVTTKARRILIIDDNDAIHHDFRKILVGAAAPSKLSDAKSMLFGDAPASSAVEASFEVDSAMQGQEGLAKLKDAVQRGCPYAVAFVDMRMPPGWDGLQTIQKLWEADPDIQIVICSAYSDFSWEEISAKLGLTDRLLILKKPFDPVEVRQLATAFSEKWALRRTAKLKMDELEQMVAQRTSELTQLALHDKLTGLPNRARFHQRLQQAVERAAANEGYRFAVLFLDFDRFKVINDSLGHSAGDSLLKAIADRLSAAITLGGAKLGEALAARLGGDEFVVLIDQLPAITDGAHFAEALLRLLGTPYRIEGRDIHSTASIGVTTSDIHGRCAEEIMRDADTAMYHAKAAGRARYAQFDRRMHEEVRARLEMENDLRGAVDRGEIVLHYQPIVSLESRRTYGFEALARWYHPKRGLVSPADFIPCCEELGLVVPLGIWILREACWQMKRWHQKYPQYEELTISVNVSACQLASPDLVSQIREVLDETKIEPSRLVLEITESVVIADADAATAVLKEIRALGVRLHMDDFGTGYSSLSSLHQLPLAGLKIDRKFMFNVSERRDYAAVVHAIVTLARNLNMKLIAEGIENAEQVALLQAMDCDLAQGFYFDEPRDAAGAEAFLLANAAFGAAA